MPAIPSPPSYLVARSVLTTSAPVATASTTAHSFSQSYHYPTWAFVISILIVVAYCIFCGFLFGCIQRRSRTATSAATTAPAASQEGDSCKPSTGMPISKADGIYPVAPESADQDCQHRAIFHMSGGVPLAVSVHSMSLSSPDVARAAAAAAEEEEPKKSTPTLPTKPAKCLHIPWHRSRNSHVKARAGAEAKKEEITASEEVEAAAANPTTAPQPHGADPSTASINEAHSPSPPPALQKAEVDKLISTPIPVLVRVSPEEDGGIEMQIL